MFTLSTLISLDQSTLQINLQAMPFCLSYTLAWSPVSAYISAYIREQSERHAWALGAHTWLHWDSQQPSGARPKGHPEPDVHWMIVAKLNKGKPDWSTGWAGSLSGWAKSMSGKIKVANMREWSAQTASKFASFHQPLSFLTATFCFKLSVPVILH